MRTRCVVLSLVVACGGSSEPEGEEGTPIVDRAPRPSHECAITQEAAVLLQSQPQQGLALARTEAGWVAARSSQDPETFEPRIALSELRFDPVELAAPQVEVAGAGYYARPELVPRGDTLGMSWVDQPLNRSGQELRSAALDGDGELVADPVTLHGAGDEVTIRTHAQAAAPDGFGILWSDDAALRFLALDASGAPVGEAVTVSGRADAAHLIRHGDGFAAVWTDESGVQLALLSDAGAPRTGPERLAAAGGDETYMSDPFAVAVGDELIVAWTEGYRSDDYTDPDGGHALVRVARVSGDGTLLGRAERLQAAEDGIVAALPSLLPIDGTLGVAWSRETFIAVCAGCVSDATINVLLLDPVDLVPVSEAVELVGPSGLRSTPMVAAEDGELAFFMTVDRHAIADVAAAKIRCAPSAAPRSDRPISAGRR